MDHACSELFIPRRYTLPISPAMHYSLCPKKGKSREYIKNWRRLSMLSVIYKIASASIANHIKPYLDFSIDNTQSGFVHGRYIGESSRLIYDIMQITEARAIPGLLVSIDFQKAFNLISWDFVYKILTFLDLKLVLFTGLSYLITVSQLRCFNASSCLTLLK